MTQHCQPLPRDVAQMMLDAAARSLCDRPGETAAQCESRTRQMIHTVWGMEPRDGLELMLAITIFGQFTMIMDSMKDILFGQEDAGKVRTKSGIVGLNRALIGMLREYRLMRTRPTAGLAEPAPAPAAEPESSAAADRPPSTGEDDALFQAQVAGFQATVMEKMGEMVAARARDQGSPAADPMHEGALKDLMSGLAAAMAAQRPDMAGMEAPGGRPPA